MTESYKLRFYGSCGHVTTEPVTAGIFSYYAAPRTVETVFGAVRAVQAEVTEEDGARIVHVVPDRWCACSDCMAETLNEIDHT